MMGAMPFLIGVLAGAIGTVAIEGIVVLAAIKSVVG